ncbi:hypothetical protein BDW22DRAFT_1320001 [Trametopsis cervina]|nr:hypothetical protein BDW22DRAFT_1320001 [Trametopsis cervina]
MVWLGQYSFLSPFISAQTSINGQVFTRGLAIFDSPAPNSVLHAGSPLSLAIDISGNGKLSQPSFKTSGIDSLNISLVSSETSLNISVATSPAFLQANLGSTVKHLDWPIPRCVPSGGYNITLYELSHIGSSPFFSITSIPVTINNESPTDRCTGVSDLETQPQQDFPPPANPFQTPPPQASSIFGGPVPPLTLLPQISQSGMTKVYSSPPPLSTPSGILDGTITYTVGPAGVQWPLTLTEPGVGTVFIGPSPSGSTISDDATKTIGGQDPDDTSTVVIVVSPTDMPTPVAVVLASIQTLTVTETDAGQASTVTTT